MPSNPPIPHLIAAFAAALAVSSPSFAQDAAPEPASASPAASPDAEIDAAARAFRAQVEAMNVEIRAAVRAAGPNPRRASAQVEEILARYQPAFEGFAVRLETWFGRRAAAAATDEARAAMIRTGAASVARIRGVPDQVRAEVAQQARVMDAPQRYTPSPMSY